MRLRSRRTGLVGVDVLLQCLEVAINTLAHFLQSRALVPRLRAKALQVDASMANDPKPVLPLVFPTMLISGEPTTA